ncbi:MAG: type II secretion system protein GspE, partial [Proteobacteria bacterium]|nr:type II secretion system protein GspE [Pseudomonadota bacterium]
MQSEPEDQNDFETAIGQLLVERGQLDRSALERALRIRNSSNEGLDRLLPKLGLATERDVAHAIAEHLQLPLVTARSFPDEPILEDKVSPRFLRETGILPLSDDEEGLVVAMANPRNAYALDAMRLISGREVHPRVAIPAELESAIERLYVRDGAPFGQGGEE